MGAKTWTTKQREANQEHVLKMFTCAVSSGSIPVVPSHTSTHEGTHSISAGG